MKNEENGSADLLKKIIGSVEDIKESGADNNNFYDIFMNSISYGRKKIFKNIFIIQIILYIILFLTYNTLILIYISLIYSIFFYILNISSLFFLYIYYKGPRYLNFFCYLTAIFIGLPIFCTFTKASENKNIKSLIQILISVNVLNLLIVAIIGSAIVCKYKA